MIYTINKLTPQIPIDTDNLIIGFFDGIHLGHDKLFHNLGRTTILTFNFFKRNMKQIFPLAKRLEIIQELYKPENIVVFDLEEINMSAEYFINNYLKQWNFKQIIVGEDFKFGNDQKDVSYLKQYFPIMVVSREQDDISTSLIKLKLMSGDIETVNNLLLIPYSYTAKVIDGNKLGRELGFPTANFFYDENYMLP